MISVSSRTVCGLTLLLWVLLLAGCAGRAPQTLPLAENERERVRAGFVEFTKRFCPMSLDADLTLEVKVLGQTEKYAGMLQYEGPSSFRYGLVDPLGRSLFILATDGFAFTMVYNREAKAVTGSTASRFWRGYVPQGVTADEILLLLAGHLPVDLRLQDIRGDREGAGFWLFGVGVEGLRHEVLFDRHTSRILRHLLKDGANTVLFDVTYDRYEATDPLCPLPVALHFEGKTITGTLSLRFDRFFSGQAISPRTFQISLPPHYTVQEVE